jgi:glycosyltransferase involved in cell wall biosynthesis
MLEVLHYYNIFSKATWGGVQAHIAALARSLRKRARSRVLVSQEACTLELENAGGIAVFRAGPERNPRGIASTVNEWTLRELARERRKLELIRKIPHDVLHVHGPLSFSGSVFGGAFFSALFPRQAWVQDGRPVVSTFHGLPEVVLPLKYADSPAKLLFRGWRGVTDKNVARSDRVICVDKYVVEELSSRGGIERKKLVFIPNGVDLSIFRPSRKKAAAKKLGLEKIIGKNAGDAPVFLYLNRLSREKGIHDIIALSKELGGKKFSFIIAGDGPYAPQVRQLCKGDARFHYFGSASTAQAPLLYNCADFVFTPLHHPGATRTNIEAVACGVPVITSGLGDRCPVVEGKTGFYYGDFDGLAELARKAADDQLSTENFGLHSRRIIGEFSIGTVAQKTLGVYRSVL